MLAAASACSSLFMCMMAFTPRWGMKPCAHGIDFLPGGPGKQQVPLQGHTGTVYRLHGNDHRRHTGLHIGGAEAPDFTIAHLRSQDIVLPVVAGWHRIQMAAEQQCRALSDAAQATDHAR